MSNSFQSLEPVKVLDPRMKLTNPRQYAVLESGKAIMHKSYTSNSVAQNSINFSCPPPSGGVVVDRKIKITLPVRLTFVGDPANTDNILQPNRDAPRAYPFSSSVETLKVSINNTAVSVNMADVIQPLLHFNVGQHMKTLDYSGTPAYPDQSQNYSDLYLTNRNPLGFYGDSTDGECPARGAFPFTIVTNTQTSAVVDMLISEYFYISPCIWSRHNAPGLYNVTTMDVAINFLTNSAMRMWSHDNSLGTNNILSMSAQFNNFATPDFSYSPVNPQLLFTYLTPQDTELISSLQPITYSYFNVVSYNTDIGAISYSSAQVGKGGSYTTNNLQLSTIPRRMYLLVRPANSDLYGSNAVNLSDAYYGISNINIQFNNNLYLNAASQQQLYDLAVKNHCNLSWNQWSGYGMHQVGSFTATKIGGIGSLIALEFGTDLPLGPTEAPGVQGQYNLQCTLNVYNCDPSGAHDALKASIYLIIVNEGSFTIPALGRSVSQLGVLSKQDVLNARQQSGIDYRTVESVNGGDFLSGLKEFGANLLQGLKDAAPYILKGVETAAKIAPLLLAAGEDESAGEGMMRRRAGEGVVVGGRRAGVSVGGVPVGGRMLSREELKRSLRY